MQEKRKLAPLQKRKQEQGNRKALYVVAGIFAAVVVLMAVLLILDAS
ncbi:hypothetical protein J31TS4_12600 [Paenibacillus sp. J31TS4]|nr:hypothetical protein [Paenibacillus sp. J31TS4]GIP37980.1 hypothetical protein J31TS4_12600 [Paenibacillus sp. J31TS4]